MEFEQLLRKYLSGTISDAELEHFQELLDRVPEYEAELRQTLEVRSLLHDDALTLTPPSDLSDHIRIAVGSSFAADAIAEREEKVRQRRILLSPLRLSVSVLATACVVAGIALSPTLPTSTALRNGAPVTSVERTEVKREAPAAPSTTIARKSSSAPVARQSADRRERSTVLAEVPAETVEHLWMVGHEVPHRLTYTPVIETESESPSTVAQSIGNQGSDFERRIAHSILSNDPAELLNKGILLPSYNPAIDSSTHRPVSEEAIADASLNEALATTGTGPRRLTFGVTLGSGQVAKTEEPTALLQNSYYLSFSVSGSDRIGVEMGESAFQQQNSSSGGFGPKRSQGGVDPNNSLFGMVVPNSGSSGGSQSESYYEGDNSSGFLTKKTIGVPTEEQQTTIPTSSRNTPPPQDNNETNEVSEKQITYGAVFYDRRININRSWDVCGRMTVGGANNALMGNVRAYAAFTPGRKNITITMGVGGATLYNFSAKGPKASVNYGVYYGIETGF